MLFIAGVLSCFTVREHNTVPTLILKKRNKMQKKTKRRPNTSKQKTKITTKKIYILYFNIKIPELNTIFQTVSIQEIILENSTVLAAVHISSFGLLYNAFWSNNNSVYLNNIKFHYINNLKRILKKLGF